MSPLLEKNTGNLVSANAYDANPAYERVHVRQLHEYADDYALQSHSVHEYDYDVHPHGCVCVHGLSHYEYEGAYALQR